MPKQAIKGELVSLSSFYCKARVERLFILFILAFKDVDKTKNLVINVECRLTELIGGGQRFNAKLRALCGSFYITVFPVLESKGH
jgi:hypothetical protein